MISQVGALPYRPLRGGDGVSILLITSRQTGRWVVPKGNLMVGKAPHEAAAIEAEEEAGVRGPISPLSLGSYRYDKLLPAGTIERAEVELFPLLAKTELDRWKEATQRQRRWFSALDAAAAVDERELGDLIRRFGEGGGPRPA